MPSFHYLLPPPTPLAPKVNSPFSIVVLLKEIDESHPCSTLKYIKHKPVTDLKGDQFLRMCKAEEDGLLTISIGIDLDNSVG